MGIMYTTPEQASVERSLIYMKKYLAGDADEAHEWVKGHALSDPEWNLRPDLREESWLYAIDLPHFEGMEESRIAHLERIRNLQAEVQRDLGDSDL